MTNLLNKRIRERRLTLNMTLLEVAELLGVKEATVQRYESGEIKNIKHDTIVALAEILNCTPSYLMGWDNLDKSAATLTGSLLAKAMKDKDALNLLENYFKLNDANKKMALGAITALVSSQEPTKE